MQYTKTDEISVGPIRKSLINDSHPGRMHLHLTEYQVGDIWTPTEDYFIDLNTQSSRYTPPYVFAMIITLNVLQILKIIIISNYH